MVKPPKRMQPDAVDLSKAGRDQAAASSFGGDSFALYMARKIHLQHQTRANLEPPPPLAVAVPSGETQETSSRTEQSSAAAESGESRRKRRRRKDERKRKESSRKRRKREKDGPCYSGVLELLQRRHGPIKKRASLLCDKDEQTEATLNAKSLNSGSKETATNNIDCTLPEGRNLCPELLNIDKDCNNSDRRTAEKQFATNTPDPDDEPVKTIADENGTAADPAEDFTATAGKNCNRSTDMRSSSQEERTVASKSCQSAPICTSPTLAQNEGEEAGDDSVGPYHEEAMATSTRRSDLFFRGIVVKFSGHVSPDDETLRRLLHRHGGDYCSYETTRVTHLVAEVLSDATAKYLLKQRNPLPVCHPNWIVESVKEGRLLPHGEYLLDQVRGPGTSSIRGFLTARKSKQSSHNVDSASGPTGVSKASPGVTNMDCEGEDFPGVTESPLSNTSIMRSALPRRQSRVRFLEPSDDNDGRSDDTEFCVPYESQPDAKIQSGEDHKMPLGSAIRMSTGRDSRSPDGGGRDSSLSDLLGVSVRDQQPTHEEGARVCENDSVQSVADVSCPVDRGLDVEFHKAGQKQPHEQDGDTHQTMSETAQVDSSAHKSAGARTDDKYIHGRIRTVGTDPDFLASFFANSRLSFIGSFKRHGAAAKEEQRQATSIDKTAAVSAIRRSDSRRFVFHIDMDCFFATVVLRKYPQYQNKPVVICHLGKKDGPLRQQSNGDLSKSTSECATCNYEARKFGITKGMYVSRAYQLCPDLVALNYDQKAYDEVSEQMSDIVSEHFQNYDSAIEHVSCDEAYVELYLSSEECRGRPHRQVVGEIAEQIRSDVLEATQCTATVGVAANKFLAKLGTDQVKPNGTIVVDGDYREVLKDAKIRDLPGIGYRRRPLLADAGLCFVRDVWELGGPREQEDAMIAILGEKTGKQIAGFCRGQDDRPFKAAVRKTIGAECNYGVRFNGPYHADHMIRELAKEVQKRMEDVEVKGSKVTLKVKQRKAGAGPPPKYLGHGRCHNLSKSRDTINCRPTRDHSVIFQIAMNLFAELNVPESDVRGMGVMMSKLVSDNDTTSASHGMSSWLEAGKSNVAEKLHSTLDNNPTTPSNTGFAHASVTRRGHGRAADTVIELDLDTPPRSQEEEESPAASSNQDLDFMLPPLSQIRMSQVEALPSPIRKPIAAKMEEDRQSRMLVVAQRREHEKFHSVPVKRPPPFARKAKPRKSAPRHAIDVDDDNDDKDTTSTFLEWPKESDLYQQDIKPLTDFMNEHEPTAGGQSVALVQEFLCTVVTEQRLSHVSLLLRTIRNRQDAWGEVFDTIFERVNETVMQVFGWTLAKK